MKLQSLLFYLLFAIGASSFTTAKAQAVNVIDSLALVNLYRSTNGPEWYNHTNWLTAAPVGTWYGITVKGTRVTKISLEYNDLAGHMPYSIGSLVKLQYLSLADYQLSGTIPSSIGNLVDLETLALGSTQLSGSIPYSIGNLVKLQNLSLSGNKLSGIIPFSIGNLINLKYLDLSVNQLSGPIPASVGNLVKLQGLLLYGNQLSGALPAAIGNLVNLRELDLYDNQLSGTMPSSIGNLVSLQILYAWSNQLSGAIPATIGNLKEHLISVGLAYNQLSGAIPSSIGNLAHLWYLDLSHNSLSDSMPSSIGNMAAIGYLDLSYNGLTGSIPASFKNLNTYGFYPYDHIDISNNHLTQSTNVDFPLLNVYQDLPVDMSYNNFTFDGLEFVATKYHYIYYAFQAPVPIHQHNNMLAVYAGGTLSNNTYNWFKVGAAGSTTIKSDSTFTPTQNGKYYAKITNAVATQLILTTDTIEFTANILTATNRSAVNTNGYKATQALQAYPSPASSTVQVQVNGTATILFTTNAGKVMLSKTITNSATIDVSSFANGVYYLQNKTTGEVQKIVVSH